MKKRILFSGICLGLLFVLGSCGMNASGTLTGREENISREINVTHEATEQDVETQSTTDQDAETQGTTDQDVEAQGTTDQDAETQSTTGQDAPPRETAEQGAEAQASAAQETADQGTEAQASAAQEAAAQETIEPLDILAELEQVEEQSAQLEEQITTYASSQLELNLASRDLYYLWDEELNDIWSRLKELLSEEEMSALTTEELEWIAFKEAEAEAAGSEYEGGSMQPMIMNLRKAELTRERVYELAAYLGE